MQDSTGQPVTQHSFNAIVFTTPLSIDELSKQMGADGSSIDPHAAISQKTSDGGIMFLFNFGAIGFWNVSPKVQQEEIEKLVGSNQLKTGSPIREDFLVQETEGRPKVEFSKLLIDHLTMDRAEVIAATLSQSATMELYENYLESAWSSISPLVDKLEKKGRLTPNPRSINRKIAHALMMRNDVVRVLHLLDRPDLIWEDKVMDEIYSDLRAMFDLSERFQALEYKLKLIQETLEILLDVVRDRRLYFVEGAIVLLIVFDIVITMTDKIMS